MILPGRALSRPRTAAGLKRVGDDACPFTTLFWDFLARNRSRLGGYQSMTMPLRNLDRMGDLDAVRARAAQVLEQLDAGAL